jgi:phospholipid/cholesterol/gamma-HCH transport system substrate-binding protein
MKRRNEVLVGMLITAAVVIGVLGTVWLVRGGLRSGYPLYSVFGWDAAELKVGQPVRLAGVQVGYIKDVVLRDNGTLVVSMDIAKGRRVPRNARAIPEAVGLFGDAQVTLQATPDPRSYSAGDTIPTGTTPPGIPQLTAKADSVATTAVALSRQVQTQLVDSGGFRDLRATINRTNALVAQLASIATQQNRQLTATQAQVRRSLAGIDSAKIDSTLSNVRLASGNAAQLTDSLRATSARLNAVLGQLQDGRGSAGKLLSDTVLYANVSKLVARLDTLSADFQKNPGKYTRGIVRIF